MSEAIKEEVKSENEVEKMADKLEQVNLDPERIQVSRKINNNQFPDLQGFRVYTVHFCEYKDGALVQDIPVFTASSPEWAFGYCKNHTEIAAKGNGTTDWWYYYITEESINDDEGQGWIAIIDWEGKIRSDTYRIDKGYDHKYVKDHVIYEQDTDGDCERCAEAEKDEEDKTRERTQAAIKEASQFVKSFFKAEKVGIKEEGDWVKMFAMGTDTRITDSDYRILHQKYGIVARNRILFYASK